jgi:hypothetical protein
MTTKSHFRKDCNMTHKLYCVETHDPEPQLNDDCGDYFGNCPVCGTSGCYLNLGRTHVFYCEDHKIGWVVGSNLFSSWREETEEDWQRNLAKLDDFQKIDARDACTPDQRKAFDEFERRHDEWLSRHSVVKAVPAMPDGYDDHLPF